MVNGTRAESNDIVPYANVAHLEHYNFFARFFVQPEYSIPIWLALHSISPISNETLWTNFKLDSIFVPPLEAAKLFFQPTASGPVQSSDLANGCRDGQFIRRNGQKKTKNAHEHSLAKVALIHAP